MPIFKMREFIVVFEQIEQLEDCDVINLLFEMTSRKDDFHKSQIQKFFYNSLCFKILDKIEIIANNLTNFDEIVEFISILNENREAFASPYIEVEVDHYYKFLMQALQKITDFCKNPNSFADAIEICEKLCLHQQHFTPIIPNDGPLNFYEVAIILALDRAFGFGCKSNVSGSLVEITQKILANSPEANPNFLQEIDDLSIGELIRTNFFKYSAAEDEEDGFLNRNLSEIEEEFIDFLNLLKDTRINYPLSRRNKIFLLIEYERVAHTFLLKREEILSQPDLKLLNLSLNLFRTFYQKIDYPSLQEIYDDSELEKELFKTKPGQKLDPVLLFAEAIINTNTILIEKNLEVVGNFLESTYIGLEMMNGVGKDNYIQNCLYQALSGVWFSRFMMDILAECNNAQDFEKIKSTIKQRFDYYKQAIDDQKNSRTVGIYIFLYLLFGEEELRKSAGKLIGEIEDRNYKMACLEILASAIFNKACAEEDKAKKRQKFKEVVNVLNHQLFSELTFANDRLVVFLLSAKIVLEEEISQYDERAKNLQIVPAQEPNLVTIFYHTRNAKKALEVINSVAQNPDVNAYIAFITLANFRDRFIYKDLYAVDKTLLNSITQCYESLLGRFSQERDYHILRILFKIHSFCGNQEKSSQYLEKLALIDDNFRKYQQFLAENPELDAENKSIKLQELTGIIDDADRQMLDELTNAKLAEEELDRCRSFVKTSAIIPQEQKHTATLEGITIDLSQCQQIRHPNTVYFLYLKPETLEEIGDNKKSDMFRAALRRDSFADSNGQNGVKFLRDGVYEIKINDDPRILGFLSKIKDQNNQDVNVIFFDKYCAKAHSGNNFQNLIDQMRERAEAIKKQTIPSSTVLNKSNSSINLKSGANPKSPQKSSESKVK